MKVAKNVENLGDAAFVKAKGTWYRARKCHKVKLYNIEEYCFTFCSVWENIPLGIVTTTTFDDTYWTETILLCSM